jgi:hypothetical protein
MELGKFKEFEIGNDIIGGVKSKPVYKHKKADKRFLKGPIDWGWLTKAANLSGKTLHVGLALHFIAGLTKINKIKMQGRVLKELGIGRGAYYNALRELEEAQLIAVDKKPGRTHVVTINNELVVRHINTAY